jgi:uncharacterized repeat protein (TIGR01451 family)
MERRIKNKRKNLAVTEIVGTIIMLGIATSSLSVVYYNVASAPTPNPAPIVEISGMFEDNQIIVTHQGGVPLDLDTELVLNVGGSQKSFRVGDFLDSKSKEDGVWGLSENVIYPVEYDFDYSVYPTLDINVIDKGSNSLLMTGITRVNPTCDIGITLIVDNLTPREYENVIFTIRVTNHGNINASGASIEFLLPDGLSYYSSTMDQGSYNNSNGIWDIGQLLTEQYVDLTVHAIVEEFTYKDPTQLVMILDGSASISSESWMIALEGLASVVESGNNLPHNGAVEFTVIQFGGKEPAFAQLEIGPIVITEQNVDEIANNIRNINQIGDKTPTASSIYLAADTLKASDMFDPDITQIVLLITDGNPTHCHNPYVDGYIADAGCFYSNGPKQGTVEARNYLIELLEMTEDQDEFNVFSVDPVIDSKLKNGEITHVTWLKEYIVWPEPSYYAPPFISDSQRGWLRNVTSWEDLEIAIESSFEIIFSAISVNVNLYSSAFTDPKSVNDESSITLKPLPEFAEIQELDPTVD